MTGPATGVVLMNHASGPRFTSPDEVRRQFRGHEVVECEGDELPEAARRAIDGKVAFVGMAGGDGSIRCVASLLCGTGIPLVPVPTGTRNHFARELGIDTVARAAAAVAGHRRTVDLAEVNGERFVNNSSVGFYAALVRERAQHERRLPSALANVTAAWAQARKGHRFHVTVDGQPYRAWLVFVGNGRYGAGITELMSRSELDGGVLDVRVMRADAALARTRAVVATVLGRVGTSDLLVVREECEVVMELRTPRVAVAVDGEVVQLEPPLRFRSLPGALTVLVPAEAADGDAKVGA